MGKIEPTKILGEEVVEAIENLGWSVMSAEENDDSYELRIANSTPLGEDIEEFIVFQSDLQTLVDETRNLANSYDANDHAALYVSMRGKNGVPDSVIDLAKDAKWLGDAYNDLADAIQDSVATLNEV